MNLYYILTACYKTEAYFTIVELPKLGIRIFFDKTSKAFINFQIHFLIHHDALTNKWVVILAYRLI